MSISAKILRNLSELEAFRPVWESWPGHRDSQIDFFAKVVQATAGAVCPFVVVIQRDRQPDALLIGRIDETCLEFGIGYFRLKPRAKVLRLVNGALRGNAGSENQKLFFNTLMEVLHRKEIDVVSLNYLPTDSELYRLAATSPLFTSRDHFRTVQPHYSAVLPDNVAGFYKQLSSKARWQVRSKCRKFEAAFPDSISIRCLSSADDVDLAMTEVERVACKTYQRGLGVGFVKNAETRERWELKARKKWFRAYLLYVNNCPAAFWTGDILDEQFRSEYLGYDAAFGQYSPGIYLITKTIERFCDGSEAGVKVVDFATGYAQYKEVLANRQCIEGSPLRFALSLRGVWLSFLSLLTNFLRFLAMQVLRQTKLLGTIKKAWRERVRPPSTVSR